MYPTKTHNSSHILLLYYQAYHNWLRKTKKDWILPGLNFTNDQLFYLSFAQVRTKILQNSIFLLVTSVAFICRWISQSCLFVVARFIWKRIDSRFFIVARFIWKRIDSRFLVVTRFISKLKDSRFFVVARFISKPIDSRLLLALC